MQVIEVPVFQISPLFELGVNAFSSCLSCSALSLWLQALLELVVTEQ